MTFLSERINNLFCSGKLYNAMNAFKLYVLSLALPLLLMGSCKSDNENNDKSSQSGTENQKNTNGEVVKFKVLKNALPETMAGLKRISHTGQKSTFTNMQISNAQAIYSEGEKRINATIVDIGGAGTAMTGWASWSTLDIKKETADGFERTTNLFGHKAFEKFNKISEDAEVAILYNDRFVVTLNGHKVSIDELRDVIRDIQIKD